MKNFLFGMFTVLGFAAFFASVYSHDGGSHVNYDWYNSHMNYKEQNWDNLVYYRKIEVIEVEDGDTFLVWIDHGFNRFERAKIRILGINTPEVKLYKRYGVTQEEKDLGLDIKDIINEKYGPGTKFLMKTKKSGKFGRYLAELWDSEGRNYQSYIEEEGWDKEEDNYVLKN